MPLTSQEIAISGVSQESNQGFVFVTYQTDQLGEGLTNPTGPWVDEIPGFLYLMGNVKYRKDSQGNVYAVNPNADGSLPI